MHRGRVIAELSHAEATEDAVGRAAVTGHTSKGVAA
jgi:hypothetical protein